MFTQCPKCETVFRLSAESLRAAGGRVRCGRCGEVFSALARLAEDASEFSKGESSYEMETHAEEILHETQESAPAANDADAAMQTDAPSGVEMAQLQFLDHLDEDLSAETSLEFTLPPGDLDRIFIETRRSPLRQLDGAGQAGHGIDLADAARAPAEEAAANADSSAAPKVIALPGVALPGVALPGVALSTSDAPSEESANPAVHVLRNARPSARAVGLEISEDVRREMMSSHSRTEWPSDARPTRWLAWAVWFTAALVLGLLLAWQIFRGNQNWLKAHVPMLRDKSAASLASYQLRQWGVSGDPGAKGTLRMRASILNTAAQLQPYPLLRVTLANRFGTRVGTRDFEPAEYLGKATARMLGPGERVDATLDILDPGKDAEGFEIDVCIRDSEKQVVCAADAAAGSAASLQ